MIAHVESILYSSSCKISNKRILVLGVNYDKQGLHSKILNIRNNWEVQKCIPLADDHIGTTGKFEGMHKL